MDASIDHPPAVNDNGQFSTEVLTQEDILQASKALFDELRALLGPLEARIAALEAKQDGQQALRDVLKGLPVPQVHVTIPQPRLVSKKIAYNAHGQPETIIEEELKKQAV